MRLIDQITAFANAIKSGQIEVYNEFSLQHELGIFLRTQLGECKIRFERHISHFKLLKAGFIKREIDISITSASGTERLSAIELKYPRSGRVPETMFDFCKDISFLEQLVAAGFQSGYFLAVVDDAQYYSGKCEGIYGLFRGGTPINGKIRKPTGAKDDEVTIAGSYTASWVPLSGTGRFCLLEVQGPTQT